MDVVQVSSGVMGLSSGVTLMTIIAIILVFVFYVKSRNRHRERMELIRRGLVESGYDDLNVARPPLPGGAALVAGLLITATGIAGLISVLILTSTEQADAAPFLLMWVVPVIFVGGALLLYYRMLAPLRDKAKKAYDLQLEALQRKVELQGRIQEPVTGEAELEVEDE